MKKWYLTYYQNQVVPKWTWEELFDILMNNDNSSMKTEQEIVDKIAELEPQTIPPWGEFTLRRRNRYWIQALEWVQNNSSSTKETDND